MGMNEHSREPEVVLDYEECGRADVSRCFLFREEKGSGEPEQAEGTSQS